MDPGFVIDNAAPGVALGVKTFKKEVLREGVYQHPLRPWPTPLKADAAYLSSVAARSNEAVKRGIKVPVPDGHQPDNALSNTGFARNFTVEKVVDEQTKREVSALFMEYEVEDPKYAEKVGKSIQTVSAYLRTIGDGQWSPDGDRVVHVALTPYPVASRQGNFVALSLGGDVNSPVEVPVLAPVSEPPAMKIKVIETHLPAFKMLGYEFAVDAEVEVSEDLFLKALSVAGSASAEAAEAKKALEAAVAAKSAPVDVAKALSVDPKVDRYFSKGRAAVASLVEGEVVAALKAGKVTKDGADALRVLLSVDNSYTLSAEGVAEVTDVAAAARKLLSSLLDGSAVPVNPAANATTTEPGKVEPKGLSAEEAAEHAKRIAGHLSK